MKRRWAVWALLPYEGRTLVGYTVATVDELLANLDGWRYRIEYETAFVLVLGPA